MSKLGGMASADFGFAAAAWLGRRLYPDRDGKTIIAVS